MTITNEALDLIARAGARKERARQAHLREMVDTIKAAHKPTLTDVELSLALGVTAPALGQRGGTALVSRWYKGSHRIGDDLLLVLECLYSQSLKLVHKGFEGRRRLFDIEPAVVPFDAHAAPAEDSDA